MSGDEIYVHHILEAIESVDIDVVWQTITEDLPALKKQLESLV